MWIRHRNRGRNNINISEVRLFWLKCILQWCQLLVSISCGQIFIRSEFQQIGSTYRVGNTDKVQTFLKMKRANGCNGNLTLNRALEVSKVLHVVGVVVVEVGGKGAADLEPATNTSSLSVEGLVWKYNGLTLTWGRLEYWLESTTDAEAAAPIRDGEGCIWRLGGSLNGDSGLVDRPPSGVVEMGDISAAVLFCSLSWALLMTKGLGFFL